MLLQVLMAVFMEKNTPKNSTNSSKPSSQAPKADTAISRAGVHTKGMAQRELRSGNTRTVETVQISSCATAGD